jgi:hypothetical protein
MSIKSVTYPVTLAGKDYELRFDITALTAAHAALRSLGMSKGTVWQLADLPYDLPEEVVLLQTGLNGAKRVHKDKDMYTIDDVQEILQEHLDSQADRIGIIEHEDEAIKMFMEEQQKLMDQINEAVKGAIGFRSFKGKPEAERPKSGKSKPAVDA